MKYEKLKRLATERSYPCVTISMNTHRTHPDNSKDIVGLKNHLSEAKNRVIQEFGKRNVIDLLEKIESISSEIDHNYNLNSLHIFLSKKSKEIVRSPLNIQNHSVHISNSFAIKPLIKAINQTQEYYILLLSQSRVKLLYAINDAALLEISDDDFPLSENLHYISDKNKLSDGKQVDNMVREFFNKVDKAMVKITNRTGCICIVIGTEDNCSRLLQVADKPSIYSGFSDINYNDSSDQSLAAQAWLLVKELHHQSICKAVIEMKDAIGKGIAITNLSNIYKAVKEGRGDLLITHNNYSQAVKMTNGFSFEPTKDNTQPGVIDDIISEIAWEVIARDGRAIFVDQDDILTLSNISLKLRY